MSLFDAYLVVDWSGNSKPKLGNDSIWYCLIERIDGRSFRPEVMNLSTRCVALEMLRTILLRLSARGRRTFIGFDFPFGYPEGFAKAAGFEGEPWRGVWEGLTRLIEDHKNNENNRFIVAGQLNRLISGGNLPFWGHHYKHKYKFLRSRKSAVKENPLPERRLCEYVVHSAKSCWQLFGNGSVGSQALLGIPILYKLLQDKQLAEVLAVWPFETGLNSPILNSGDIILAEVYPSLFGVGPTIGRDRWQVRNTALRLAIEDRRENLADYFCVSVGFNAKQIMKIEKEEGWILGAGAV